jgi:ribosomal-protein-alanine N-acetyltransferase
VPLPAIVRIELPRLTLRPVLATDLADLLEVNRDPQVTRFLPYPAWQSLEDGGAWLSRMEALGASGTGRQLVLVAKPDSRVIGTLLLFRFNEASSRLELGYALARNYWGQGFMTEAVDAACSHAFGELNIRRIEAEVNPANAASCRLLLNAGFALEGNLRQRWVVKGVTYDTCIYGCLAEDWRRKRGDR